MNLITVIGKRTIQAELNSALQGGRDIFAICPTQRNARSALRLSGRMTPNGGRRKRTLGVLVAVL